MNLGDSVSPAAPTEMPMCVMDGTDVETVVIASEWTEIEMHAKQQTKEDDCEDGDNSLPAADCDQSASQPHRHTEESEIQTEKHTDTENCLGESTLMCNQHDESLGCIQDRSAVAEHLGRNAKLKQSLSCSTTPPLGSTVHADGAVIPAGTRRSARKPKKTWKLKLVNLQKQKHKPGMVARPKQERTPLALMKNSGTSTEIDEKCIDPDNRLVLDFY